MNLIRSLRHAVPRLGLLALAATLAGAASAQESTNHAALKRLSQQFLKQSTKEQSLAKQWADKHGWPTTWVTPTGQTMVLNRLTNGLPRPISTYNLNSAATIGANQVWPGGIMALNLAGGGQTVGLWEPGAVPFTAHRELVGRITVRDGASFAGDHATHTAGTMIASGLNRDARGMAYLGRVDAYDANNDQAEVAMAATNDGLKLSNHSYGPTVGWYPGLLGDGKWVWMGDTRVSEVEDFAYGFYDSESRAWDLVQYNAPYYLFVGAAGNVRDYNPPTQPVDHWVFDFAQNQWVESNDERAYNNAYDTLSGTHTTSKNSLVVGAVEGIFGGYTNPADVVMSSFSAWGPTDDGRIKPDLVTKGVGVLSTVASGGYEIYQGTSMASPAAAGALQLMVQHYQNVHGGQNMRASTVKALAIQTANEAGNAPGPDYQYGWGLLNIPGMAKLISKSESDPMVIQERTLNTGGSIKIPVSIGAPGQFKVTIAWTDPAGTPVPNALDPVTPMLVNDIDLRIERDADKVQFLPYILDPANPSNPATSGDNTRDNVEQIQIDNPGLQTYTVVITHKGGNLRPFNAQVVSIVIDAPTPDGFAGLTINPDSVVGGIDDAVATLALSAPASENTVVRLSSSHPNIASVDATVVVAKGKDSVDIPVKTYAVRPTDDSGLIRVTLIASSSLGQRSATLDVLPVTVQSLDLTSYNVVGGTNVTGTVTLNSPAPERGATVSLESSLPGVARPMRNWVTVPRGQTSVKFTVRTVPVNEGQSVVLRARRLGTVVTPVDSNGETAPLVVSRPNLSAASFEPTTQSGGKTVKLSITLDGPAPKAGAVVTLLSSDPTILSVPAQLTVSSGRKTQTLTLTANKPGTARDITVTVTRGNVSKTATVRINP